MSDPTPPAVSEAMREAVARSLGDALVQAGLGRSIGVLAFEEVVAFLVRPAGPIASEIARLTGERDAAREDLRTSNRERNEAIETAAIAHAAHAGAEAEAEELLAGIQAVIAARDAAEAALSRLQADRDAEVGKLRAALEPFVAEARRIYAAETAEEIGDRVQIWQSGGPQIARSHITYGDLRRARAALTETSDA